MPDYLVNGKNSIANYSLGLLYILKEKNTKIT